MKINIQSPGFKVNPQLNLFIQEKAEKLFNYYSDLISIEISLKISNSDTKENKVCEIRLVIPVTIYWPAHNVKHLKKPC
ncbi:MAG: HPF/RaiA family ribosome-associated protein [Chitinophagaceae bacterium]|nr:HPF/RaiA family ribosome-associated protein [Chitinophagaceae bacterium]